MTVFPIGKADNAFFQSKCAAHPSPNCCSKGKVAWRGSVYTGPNETNNTAEYEGLIMGLRAAKVLGEYRILAIKISNTSEIFVATCPAQHSMLIFGRSKELDCQRRLKARPPASRWHVEGQQAPPRGASRQGKVSKDNTRRQCLIFDRGIGGMRIPMVWRLCNGSATWICTTPSHT